MYTFTKALSFTSINSTSPRLRLFSKQLLQFRRVSTAITSVYATCPARFQRWTIFTWRGNGHRSAIIYPAVCMCALFSLHRRRPVNANGLAEVIIASQRARSNTWLLIIEMSAYLARRWNRVSRAAVSGTPAVLCSLVSWSGLPDRGRKNRAGKSTIPVFIRDTRSLINEDIDFDLNRDWY